MKTSYYTRIELPADTSTEARETFAELALRLAARFTFQGMEDWAVDAPRSKVLGIEREFLDLRSAGTVKPEMRVYFARKSDAALYGKALRTAFADLKVSLPRQLRPRDWMREWRKHYKIQKLKEGKSVLAIVPSWKRAPKVALALRISPGQAFGTGTHATTQLCLRLFLRHAALLPADEALKVLDFGAGTGVLAIAAEKWAAREDLRFRAWAVESDPVALEQCRKNLRLNRSKGVAAARKMAPKGCYGLVFANVLAPVLLDQREVLQGAVAPGGLLILSGILASEAKDFLKKFRAKGFALVELATQGDWSAILLRRE